MSKVNATGSSLLYSTYLGGRGDDSAVGITLDQTGDGYVTGWTSSFDFPVTPFAFQPAINPGQCDRDTCVPGDVFVTKFSFGLSEVLSVSSITPTSGGNAGQ